ncbi:MAG: hypothetical protein JO267_09150 [Alphaproteobacteria bacterium]|nr:hypothetical protein [Alphaproteobacteria bacterium]
MPTEDGEFTPEEHIKLTQIWDRLYELYLAQANGRNGPDVAAEIAELIRQRDSIRDWGWSTGRDWREDQKKRERAKNKAK